MVSLWANKLEHVCCLYLLQPTLHPHILHNYNFFFNFYGTSIKTLLPLHQISSGFLAPLTTSSIGLYLWTILQGCKEDISIFTDQLKTDEGTRLNTGPSFFLNRKNRKPNLQQISPYLSIPLCLISTLQFFWTESKACTLNWTGSRVYWWGIKL